jgi:outer membrane protein TolC
MDADMPEVTEDDTTDEEFGPLPDSATDDTDVDLDTLLDEGNNPEVLEDIDESDEEEERAVEAPVLIPEDRVRDELQFLDPDPNPLLIQTTPEEVEIIGTQPLTLEEAVELAYRNNPDLRVVLLELEQSQASLREVQAQLFPTVSVNGALQGQNTTDASTEVITTPGGGLAFETNSNEELGVGLSAGADVVYNVYSSGLREANIRAAEEQVQLTELEVERRQAELRLATANEYYDLQAAIEAIRISQAFLEEAERNLRDTTLREEVGVGTRFDVLRAEVQVANARQDLVNSQRARQVSQRTLARRLNVPPSLTITTVPVDIAGIWPLDLEESIVLAFQNRAELEQQLTQREINEELRQAALAALGPQVDLFANYNISDILTQDDSFNDNYSFGARVTWTLFEGGAAQARAEQSELDIEIAERNFEDTRNTIRLSVESAYFTLQSNLTNIDTARLAVEQAQEALDLAILRFDAGVGTQLDILNAQSELTDAEVNLVQAIVGYNRSLAELKRAVSNLPESYYQEIPY